MGANLLFSLTALTCVHQTGSLFCTYSAVLHVSLLGRIAVLSLQMRTIVTDRV